MVRQFRALLVAFAFRASAFRSADDNSDISAADDESDISAATPLEDASAALAGSQRHVAAAQATGMLLPKWRGCTSSLQETATAAAAASEVVAAGEEKWNEVARAIATGDDAEVFDGDATYYEVQGLVSGTLALSVGTDLRALAGELSQVATLEKDTIDALMESTALTRGIEELGDAWRTIDLSSVRGLKPSADAMQSQADALARRLDAADTMLRPLLEDWDELSRWTKARRTYTNQRVMIVGLNDIGEANQAIGELLQGEARTLARNVQQSADSLMAATSEITLLSDHGLGATETIERYKCEPARVRTFRVGRLVDETTMSCIQGIFGLGYKRCSCTRAEDCYVTSEFRTTRPELKRCFRPV